MVRPTAAPPCEPSEIPVVQTERLILRPCRLSDLDPLAAMWDDPDHVRFMGQRTRPPAEVFVSLQRYIGAWYLVGYGFWVLESREDGTVLGEAGFLPGMRAILGGAGDRPEAGWSIAKTHWGRGLATEALQACLSWADRALPVERIVCVIEKGHAASVRVAHKCGFSKEADSTLRDTDVGIYMRPRKTPSPADA